MRVDIRHELKARREALSYWVVWISAFTGLVGALIELFALLLHKNA